MMNSDINEELAKFGVRVKELRQQKNLTQEQLAELIGTNRANVSKIEGGKKNVELSTIVKIAEALGEKTQRLFMTT